jgi:hypothetical protein
MPGLKAPTLYLSLKGEDDRLKGAVATTKANPRLGELKNSLYPECAVFTALEALKRARISLGGGTWRMASGEGCGVRD